MSSKIDIQQALKEYYNNKPKKLYDYCKSGLSSFWRPSIWIHCIDSCGIKDTIEQDNFEYNLEFTTALRNNHEIDYKHFPIFGGIGVWNEHSFLSDEKQKACIRIMYLLNEMYYLQFAPQIFDITCILLLYLDESRAYKIVSAMIQESKQTYKYFVLNDKQDSALISCIKNYIDKYGSRTLHSFLNTYSTFPYQRLYATWVHRLFTTWLSTDNILRIFDAYIIDGMTVLIKEILVIMEIMAQKANEHHFDENVAVILTTMREKSREFSPIPELDHLSKAFKRYSSITHIQLIKDIENLLNQSTIPTHVSNLKLTDLYRYHNIKIWDGLLLTNEMYNKLRPFLPTRLGGKDLNLLFSSAKDGYSLYNLYNNCVDIFPTLFVASISETGSLIGIYCEEEWKPCSKPSGGLDIILIQFTPEFHCWKAISQKKDQSQQQTPKLPSYIYEEPPVEIYATKDASYVDHSDMPSITDIFSLSGHDTSVSTSLSPPCQEENISTNSPSIPYQTTHQNNGLTPQSDVLTTPQSDVLTIPQSDVLSTPSNTTHKSPEDEDETEEIVCSSDDEPNAEALLSYDLTKYIYRITTSVDVSIGVFKSDCSLHFNEDFSIASSARTPVFNNKPLGDPFEFFTFQNVEVYSFIEPNF